ncbi:major facilitator superfamily transporter 18 isoform X1 [Nomia melanderi]|uniref:major facilitator superfamily transporter 18 isoform X1 n=1 Tax=Nomia melanderi TaxID=2448451 RepID=UPI0013043C38|nr:tigger transposable element-derived protein 2-like [Nomia melanderi]
MASDKRIRRTYRSLTMNQRLEVLRHLESGASTSELATKYDIHPATVCRIRRYAATLNQLTEQGVVMGNRRKLRKPVNEEVDNRLYVWYLEQLALGETLTDSLMLEKAVDIHTEYGGPSTFKASRGWLWRFKIRHDINTKRDVDVKTAKQFMENFTRCIEETSIDKENVYNFCQTGLVWRNLCTSILVRSGIKDIDGQRPKRERVTIGLCTNTTGKHKLTPLFINKFANPRVLKSWKYHLPVIFKSQRQGSLDAGLFFDWYQNHFKPEVLKHQMQSGIYGKVILILDDSQGDKTKLFEGLQPDERFQIIFFPQNTSQNLQPMNQIIDAVKKLYRNKMLHQIQSLPGGIKEFYSNFDMKECIDFLHEVWSELSTMCIQVAWKNLVKQNFIEIAAVEDLGSQLESDLQETVDVITTDQESEEEAADFVTNSVEDENFSECKIKIEPFNDTCTEELSSVTLPDESEIMTAFKSITIWSRLEPNFVRLHVKRLKKYYDKK